MRATISSSGDACQSSTFIETWTRPRLASGKPSARTPGKPPPVSRTTAAIDLRDFEVVRGEIDVEGDQRPPRADEDAAGARIEAGRAAVGVSSPASIRRWSSLEPAAPKQRRPDIRRELAVQEDR